MEFLEELNFSKEAIKKIIDNNSNIDLYELSSNGTDVSKIIEYFREIGISDDTIVDMLININYIFFRDLDDIKKSLSSENIEEVADIVNGDYLSIEEYI